MLLRHSPPQPPSYKASLTPVTRYAAIFSVIAETFFTVYYWASAYPSQIISLQVFANLLGLVGLVLILRTSATRVAGHILAGAVYLSLAGPLLFTGGLVSSATPWLVFIPIMATIVAGARGGLFWGIISLLTAVAMFLFRTPLLAWNLRPVEDVDRLTDLSMAVLSSVLAVFLNEMVKSGFMKKLDEAQARLANLANIDPLTNIYNRRYFTYQSEVALRECATGSPFSIILFDIDHFKNVNDHHGHNVGDQVLASLVQPCSAVLRKNDIFARLGGEEFIALLPDTSEAEAKEIAERLRNIIENTPLSTDKGFLRITISIGVCSCLPDEADTIQEVIRRADNAMYYAKETGRNRVIAWNEMTQP